MQVQNAYNIAGLINVLFILLITTGALWAFKKSVMKATGEIQAHTSNLQNNAIAALEQELGVVRSRINDIERENKKLDQIILTLCDAMKKRGLDISIDGNVVTVRDGKDTSVVRITGV